MDGCIDREKKNERKREREREIEIDREAIFICRTNLLIYSVVKDKVLSSWRLIRLISG